MNETNQTLLQDTAKLGEIMPLETAWPGGLPFVALCRLSEAAVVLMRFWLGKN